MPDSGLPAGWQPVPLGEVATIVMGQAPPGATVRDWNGETPEQGLPFIQGNAEFTNGHPSPVKWCRKPAKVAEAGDTLISVRAPVGEMNLADQRLAIGRGVAAVRFTGIDQRFGWHQLASARAAFSRIAQGSTFTAINSGDLAKLKLPVPPPDEQRRIAEVLDSIDAAIEKTEAVIAATERLRSSLLAELLTRGVPGWHTEWKQVPGIGTIPACWEVVRLGDVADVQTGRQVGKKPTGEPAVELPYLSVANVKDGYLHLETVKTMEVSAGEVARFSLRLGDVLFTEGGDADKLGRGCVWNAEIEPCLHQNHVFAVRPDPAQLTPDYLAGFARSPKGKRYFLGCAKQTTNLASINSTQLKAMPLPLAPMEEQVAIESTLGSIERRREIDADHLDALLAAKRAYAAALLSGRLRVGSG